jgi:hypothetical protein
MSKPNRKRFNLATLRNEHAEKSGGSTIEFDFEGSAYEIAAPGFWSDEVKIALKLGDDIAASRALMGEAYDDFVSAGGRADDVMLVVAAYADSQGVSLGE